MLEYRSYSPHNKNLFSMVYACKTGRRFYKPPMVDYRFFGADVNFFVLMEIIMIPDEYIIYLEIFGYIGTALVILSMMMSSVTYLRIFNISGSIISMTYSFISVAYPVAVLNLALIIINAAQLIRSFISKRTLYCIKVGADNELLGIFCDRYGSDIKKFFPRSEIEDEIYIVTDGARAVGVLAGKRCGDTLELSVSYAVPGYRTRYIGAHLFPKLEAEGILSVTVTGVQNRMQVGHLTKLGFTLCNGKLRKNLIKSGENA